MHRPLQMLARLSAPLVLVPTLAAQDWIDAPRIVLPDGPLGFRAVADLDGDGDADVLAVTEGANSTVLSVQAWLQEAGELLAGPTTVLPVEPDVYNGQVFVEVGDLTDDGLPDVVLDVNGTNGAPDGVRVLPSSGGGAFDTPVFVLVDGFVRGGALADADAAGALELALYVRVPALSLFALGWWRWNGTTLAALPPAVVERYDSVDAADLTGDGRSEILVVADTRLDVYASLPGEQPELASNYSVASEGREPVPYPGDLDGDGDVDVLLAWRQPLSFGDDLRLIVARNEGGVLHLGPTQSVHVGDERIGMDPGHLADWDLDGDLDFLMQHEGLIVVANRAGVFELLESIRTTEGDGAFPGAGIGDLTGDGRPDFAAGRYLYAGGGELRGAGLVPEHLGDLGPQDFDGDGDLDVVNFYLGIYSNLLENDASGNFTSRVLSLPEPSAGLLLQGASPPVDLDGDGRGDLLRVVHEDQYPTFPVIETRFLKGSAIGTYTDERAAGPPGVGIRPASHAHVAADLDGDGDPDVLTWSGYWENDGTGFFATHHASWPHSETAVRPVDVDGDGDVDVLALTYSGDLTLARNAGGVFTTEPITSLAEVEPALGDLDGDGDLDLGIGTTAGGRAVLLLENDGGSFAAPLRLEIQEEVAHRVALEDFDGDGRCDVLAMPAHPSGLEWFLWLQSTTPFQFEAPVTYLGDYIELAGDFDGDGDTDFLGTRITRSRRFVAAAGGLVRQHGPGWAAAEPAAPLLGVSGPLRPGAGAVLHVARARGGAVGQLLLSSRALLAGPAGKARLLGPPYPDVLPFALGGTPGASGEGSFELPLGPMTLALSGQRVWMQAVIADPALPRRFATTTNALELTFGE